MKIRRFPAVLLVGLLAVVPATLHGQPASCSLLDASETPAGDVELQWCAVAGATSYVVSVATSTAIQDPCDSWTVVGTPPSPSFTAPRPQDWPGVWVVQGEDAVGRGPHSNVAWAHEWRIAPIPPADPTIYMIGMPDRGGSRSSGAFLRQIFLGTGAATVHREDPATGQSQSQTIREGPDGPVLSGDLFTIGPGEAFFLEVSPGFAPTTFLAVGSQDPTLPAMELACRTPDDYTYFITVPANAVWETSEDALVYPRLAGRKSRQHFFPPRSIGIDGQTASFVPLITIV